MIESLVVGVVLIGALIYLSRAFMQMRQPGAQCSCSSCPISGKNVCHADLGKVDKQ